MTFTDDIKKALKGTHKDTSDYSLDLYIRQTERIYKDVFGKDLNKQKNFSWIKEVDKIEKYLDKMPVYHGPAPKVGERKYKIESASDSTRRNYYVSILEVVEAMNYADKEAIKIVEERRDFYKNKYEDIEDGLKSKKQEENFIDAKTINDKIDEYEKEIKQDNPDKDRLQIWMILKILRELNFRNEIATLEFVDKKTYEKEKGDSEKNMIVMDRDGWFISKNKYKTSKKYGEVIIPLDKQILKDIQFYHKQVGDGMLFKSSFQNSKRPPNMTSNSLSKYLLKWSNKELPPIKLSEGSKRPRNLSTSLIVKVYQSDKHGESKAKMLSTLSKDSKNRGNKPATMNKHYVSMRKPTGFV